MANKVIKNLVLKSKDKKIKHEFTSATVFATKYVKLLEINEFHSPTACKLIVESDNRIYAYLLSRPFIIADAKGNIEIFTTSPFKKVSMQEPYYEKEETEIAKHLFKAYKYKSALGLTPIEVMEKSRAEAIVEIDKAKNIKVPFVKGGGF